MNNIHRTEKQMNTKLTEPNVFVRNCDAKVLAGGDDSGAVAALDLYHDPIPAHRRHDTGWDTSQRAAHGAALHVKNKCVVSMMLEERAKRLRLGIDVVKRGH